MSDKAANAIAVILVLFVFVVGFVLGVLAAVVSIDNTHNAEAIEAGVAEWRIDPKTGDKEFVYLEVCDATIGIKEND